MTSALDHDQQRISNQLINCHILLKYFELVCHFVKVFDIQRP